MAHILVSTSLGDENWQDNRQQALLTTINKYLGGLKRDW